MRKQSARPASIRPSFVEVGDVLLGLPLAGGAKVSGHVVGVSEDQETYVFRIRQTTGAVLTTLPIDSTTAVKIHVPRGQL